MIKNNKLFTVLLFAVSVAVISCDDDDNGLETQSHDDNEMMSIMHDMSAEMNTMTMAMDADHDFAMMMKMHHQGAINMGNKELEKGDDATIKAMAQTMINMQQTEIQELQAFLDSHTAQASTAGEMWGMEAMKAMERMEKNADLEVLTGDVDHDMAILMINHHQSAMDMAQSLLHHGHHEELKEMATKMIEDQSMEIEELQVWLLDKKDY
ncbi:MAG: DUF305 domain-containing protein [Chryseolinea sp.]